MVIKLEKVQGVAQSQAAANSWYQEEEKKDKINACKIKKQIHIDQLSLPQARLSHC